MPLLGSHMSIAGGLPLAVDRAVAHGCEALQIFSKSSNQWRARPLERRRDSRVPVARGARGLGPVVAHACYLINLATSAPALRAQSIEAFGIELDRAEALGLARRRHSPGLLHDRHRGRRAAAGRRRGEGIAATAAAGPDARPARAHGRPGYVARMALRAAGADPRAPRRPSARRRLPRHLPPVRGRLRPGDRTRLRETFDAFRRLVGLDRLRVFHVNDSKRPLGSRRDRHEHIGEGRLASSCVPAPGERPALRARCRCCSRRRRPRGGRRSRSPSIRWTQMNLRTLRRLMMKSVRA